MGLDFTAITVVGVKLPISRVLKGNIIPGELENTIGFLDRGNVTLGEDKYELTLQLEGYERLTDDIFVCIWKSEKDGYRGLDKTVPKCPYSLLQLMEKSNKLKAQLVKENYLTDEEYGQMFGIYTLSSYSY
jgi:hypothetical protein